MGRVGAIRALRGCSMPPAASGADQPGTPAASAAFPPGEAGREARPGSARLPGAASGGGAAEQQQPWAPGRVPGPAAYLAPGGGLSACLSSGPGSSPAALQAGR